MSEDNPNIGKGGGGGGAGAKLYVTTVDELMAGIPVTSAAQPAAAPVSQDEDYIPVPQEEDFIPKREAVSYDENKARYDLVPPEIMEAIAQGLTVGAQKYPERNWEDGMRWGRIYAQVQRHLQAFWAGEDVDAETQLPHMWLAATRLAMLITYDMRGIGTDDRKKIKK